MSTTVFRDDSRDFYSQLLIWDSGQSVVAPLGRVATFGTVVQLLDLNFVHGIIAKGLLLQKAFTKTYLGDLVGKRKSDDWALYACTQDVTTRTGPCAR